MLVLTRKYQEKIRIGNNITITVLRTKGKAVRLGIEAPPDVPVIRGELSFEPKTATADSVAEVPVVTQQAARVVNAAAAWPAQTPDRRSGRTQATEPIAKVE